MSAIVLDTHVFIWLVMGEDRISDANKRRIDAAARGGMLYVAAITPWEVATLVAKSRLSLSIDIGDWMRAAFTESGIGLIALSPEIAVASTRLPDDFHADPADRMIVASARHVGAPLMTEDAAILAYARRGHVRAIRAGR